MTYEISLPLSANVGINQEVAGLLHSGTDC